MARPKLKIQKRKIFGRKVKKLRAEGILPADVYGRKIKSEAVQLKQTEFMPIYQETGETGLIDLLLEDEKTARPVLIHNVQLDPVSERVIHVDFHQVSLTEKISAQIPVELVGESPAVEQKLGILVRLLSEIEVEALPEALPEKIEVDISSLSKVDDMVKVGDLKVDEKKIKILAEPNQLIVKIEPPAKIEVEPVAPVAEEAAGEAPAEGETKAAEAGAQAEKAAEKPEEGKSEKK